MNKQDKISVKLTSPDISMNEGIGFIYSIFFMKIYTNFAHLALHRSVDSKVKLGSIWSASKNTRHNFLPMGLRWYVILTFAHGHSVFLSVLSPLPRIRGIAGLCEEHMNVY